MTDLECRIISQVGAIEHECGRQAFVWQMHRHRGLDYVPPLFVGHELPVAPIAGLPPIVGVVRKEARR